VRIEPRSAWAYIFLACGRITTPEEQEFFSVWKPRRGLYYCTSCKKWKDKLKGAALASYRATRPNGWPCADGSRFDSVGGTPTNQPSIVSPVPMHVAIPRKDGKERNQIPLPGMPN
jgi:hypothetical protein